MSPELLALLKKMGQDDLNDLAVGLVPALEAEINHLFPAAAPLLAGAELALNPVLQAAIKSLVDKVQL